MRSLHPSSCCSCFPVFRPCLLFGHRDRVCCGKIREVYQNIGRHDPYPPLISHVPEIIFVTMYGLTLFMTLFTARRVAGRPKSVATAGAGLFGLEATRGCAGKGNV